MNAEAPAVVYNYRDKLYVNLTNRCPVACAFCVKRTWHWRYRGWNLKLGALEPDPHHTAEKIGAALKRYPFRQVVFCGYGEPTYRLAALTSIARRLKEDHPAVGRRLNTIGLGSMICGRDIVPELAGVVDEVSVSLNTSDPALWRSIHAPLPPFRKDGFEAVLAFIRSCVAAGLATTISAVAQPGVDLPALRRLSRDLGARFRSRPWLGPIVASTGAR